ncbi:IMP dehydrogenase [Patescibacteria group bacterium]|nr:IMP dehydrogenase [Patescibacteria group bacterium]MBU1915926.1 IMP dehydrogenase [Patescibacteria group bacterium]
MPGHPLGKLVKNLVYQALKDSIRGAGDELYNRLEELMYPGHDGNGITREELFRMRAGTGITFDDFNILPRFVNNPPDEINLWVPFGPRFDIIPIVGSPMDRVTEWLVAVHLALNGCLGFSHINLSNEEAVRQALLTKRWQQGLIWTPLCRKPTHVIRDARAVQTQYGFSTILITEDGTQNSPFEGLVTKYCIDFEEDENRPLGEVMIPREQLRLFSRDEVRDMNDARRILRSDPRITKMPILDGRGCPHALVNRKAVSKSDEYPNALVDDNNRLRVGAAVRTHPEDDELVRKLIDAEVDALLVDSSQGGTSYMLRRIRQIRSISPEVTIVAGNVVTPRQAQQLVSAGADVLRIGMGPGSICTTQGKIGIGRAQGSAVCHLRQVGTGIADGGIREVGDMVKALALGASHIMVGRYIAGCDESPAPEIEYNGRRYKMYRGMGSIGAMTSSGRGGSRYDSQAHEDELVAQGVEDQPIPAIGSLDRHLRLTIAGLKKALETLGCASVAKLHTAVAKGDIRFELRSEAAKIEGKPHDLLTLSK